MATLDEALEFQPSPLASALATGVAAISANAVIDFVLYVRLVLPLDGYVFWVRANLVSESAVYNAARYNAVVANQPQTVVAPAKTFSARGSLHYATDTRQEEAESYSANRVVFTALDEMVDLNATGPNAIYIGTLRDTDMQFAFSSRGSFYEQAKLYHYVGAAVYADMRTQVVDRVDGFNSQDVIVSNSLPIWLSMNQAKPTPWRPLGLAFTLYPSFLVPQNITPPFAAVHVIPEGTRGLASAPTLGPTLSHDQLVADRVRVTLWGVRNRGALDFVDFVDQFTLDDDVLGMMNVPVPRDEKRAQLELNVIAQKKTIEFEVSYLQSTARDVARQLIKEVIPSFYFGD